MSKQAEADATQHSTDMDPRGPPPPYNPQEGMQAPLIQELPLPQGSYMPQQPTPGVQIQPPQQGVQQPHPQQPLLLPQMAGPGVVVVPAHQPLYSEPMVVTCTFCHAVNITRIERSSGFKTHMIALILCMIGCWPCCLYPYCMDDCQDTSHFCSNCGSYQGKHQF